MIKTRSLDISGSWPKTPTRVIAMDSCYSGCMAPTTLPKLRPHEAFVHVVYEHRWFAVAAGSWERYAKQSSSNEDWAGVTSVVPGIGVMIRDSLLLHSRNLLEFYAAESPKSTDIKVTDFDLPSPEAAGCLSAKFKNSISVHLFHLTAWRDVTYRELHSASPQGDSRARPQWDFETCRLVSRLFDCLDKTAGIPGRWQTPFVRLNSASRALKDNPAAIWPAELAEAADISEFLRSLGL